MGDLEISCGLPPGPDFSDLEPMVGDRERIGRHLTRMGAMGIPEVTSTASGPDVAREPRAFAPAFPAAVPVCSQ